MVLCLPHIQGGKDLVQICIPFVGNTSSTSKIIHTKEAAACIRCAVHTKNKNLGSYLAGLIEGAGSIIVLYVLLKKDQKRSVR
jgi:hypothetical protein